MLIECLNFVTSRTESLIVGLCLPSTLPPMVSRLRDLVSLKTEDLIEASDLQDLETSNGPNVYFDRQRSILYRKFYEDR